MRSPVLAWHRTRTVPALATLAVLLAACGSQLDPNDVRALNDVPAPGAPLASTTAGALPGTVGAPGALPGANPNGSHAPAGTTNTPGAVSAAGPGPAASGGGAHPAQDNCAGFDDHQPGVTPDKIVIANSSDLSGPVPGLFQSAQDATKAYAAYFDASGQTICGHHLDVLALDSRTDAGADQQAYQQACEQSFAAVGSMSAFDLGGAATAQQCGLPDLRSAAVTTDRNNCTTCFGTESTNTNAFENAVPDYTLKYYKGASQAAAFLYVNAGAAAINAGVTTKALTKRGMKFVYVQGIDVSDLNYTPYVQAMEDKHVRYVQYLGSYQGAVRLAQAMEEQSFKPDVFMLDPTAYTQDFLSTGGSAVEGVVAYINFVPFESMSSSREETLYYQWLQQVHPGAQPSFFGLFAWSAAKLFAERAQALGGRLTRAAMVDELRKVNGWTADGLHAPQYVGAKRVSDCWRFMQVRNGRWVPVGGTAYWCHGTTSVS
jgi:hypothetical protein